MKLIFILVQHFFLIHAINKKRLYYELFKSPATLIMNNTDVSPLVISAISGVGVE